MYICKNCGASYNEHVAFCAQCGSNLITLQQDTPPAYNPYEAPAAPTPAYSYAAPAPASENKVPAILSLVFGAIAAIIAFSLIGVLADYISMSSYPYYYGYSPSYSVDALAAFFGCSLFIVPGAILGMIMSGKTQALKGMSIAGKISSIVSLGLLGIAFFMTIGVCAM